MNSHRGYTHSYGNLNPLAASVAVEVLAPAANVRGCVVRRVHIRSSVSDATSVATSRGASLIAKAAAPASEVDGDVIAMTSPGGPFFSTPNFYGAHGFSDNVDILVPAGKGLYFFATAAESYGSRSVLYELL